LKFNNIDDFNQIPKNYTIMICDLRCTCNNGQQFLIELNKKIRKLIQKNQIEQENK